MKRRWLIIIISAAIVVAGALAFWLWPRSSSQEVIKVGLLQSLTGPLWPNEKGMIDASIFAIEEINEKGGVLGKKILPIIADGKSDWPTFAKEAERLITQEKVKAIFGCTTSASRKVVKDVVEKYNNLLFYPVQYEGLESSKNIIYLGATANQQAIPAVVWALDNLGTKLFLVGSDYVYQRAVNAIIKDVVKARGGSIVGESYLPINNYDVTAVIKEIVAAQPKAIINTIVGKANVEFFNSLREVGISSEKIPSISLSVMEMELMLNNLDSMIGDYGVQNYFESLDSPANKIFVNNYKRKFGENARISNNMENAYNAIYFWRDAVKQNKSTDTDQVREALVGHAMSTPEGIVSVDEKNQHLWKPVLVGKILPNQQFGIVWNSVSTIKPVPYPPFRSVAQWQELLNNLYNKWGQKWWP